MTVDTILLSGVVGSTAYGLARAGSDIDRLGLFAAPTERLLGLHRPKESHVSTAPDRTLHEAGKWCRLALGGNPTVMELVWLPEEFYEVRTPLGDELIGIRTSFLSATRVRDAYLGYATQQFRKLLGRGDGPLSAEASRRTAKHARHLKRLCVQGLELYATGRLTVRVEDPEAYHRFGERVADDPTAAASLMRRFEEAFDTTPSVLPPHPDESAAEAWLLRVRRAFYLPGEPIRDGSAA
ncbi:nucleotidyltransferase domain-containing protein [Streptomyces actuosus]|uniref:Nucleotidyltransferase domain-containing protein n=1 Tax=Streptomyces actuosus TaxID=1885 RepID=A0ABS2VMW9_STRAS|nr:nucleotidyltransferase domain-containing protein [Streptomyces actuosus]MBN0044453.1 nucleotidyltransferase domain-containing protein [Streptomyces actuosus]